MKYAVLQNSTQEIIDWFKKLPFTVACNLSGEWKYLVYCPETQDSYFTDYIFSTEEILLTPEEFTKKFITNKNVKEITYKQAQSIIDIACDVWKDHLFSKWGKDIVFKKKY